MELSAYGKNSETDYCVDKWAEKNSSKSELIKVQVIMAVMRQMPDMTGIKANSKYFSITTIAIIEESRGKMLFLPRQANAVRSEWEKIYTNMTLYNLGCPIFKSAVILPDERIDQQLIDTLTNYFGTDQVMIRYQYIVPNNHPVQTGNKYTLSTEALSSIQNKETVLWVMEPINRLENDYGINILFNKNECVIEIVGRGFDASDLTRGRISPQQVITTELPLRLGYNNEWWKFLSFSFQDKKGYRTSMNRRIEKLNEMGYSVSYEIFNKEYKPLSTGQLEELLTYISKIYSGLQLTDYCVSLSIYRGQYVFWDIQTSINKMRRFGS